MIGMGVGGCCPECGCMGQGRAGQGRARGAGMGLMPPSDWWMRELCSLDMEAEAPLHMSMHAWA
jgi:hypothetical protein